MLFTILDSEFTGKAKPFMERHGMPFEFLRSEGGFTTYRVHDVIFDN